MQRANPQAWMDDTPDRLLIYYVQQVSNGMRLEEVRLSLERQLVPEEQIERALSSIQRMLTAKERNRLRLKQAKWLQLSGLALGFMGMALHFAFQWKSLQLFYPDFFLSLAGVGLLLLLAGAIHRKRLDHFSL